MSKNSDKRKCSAVCRNGQPCQAWAIVDSEPALCSAHAGRSVGAGAPQGHKNAMKHGLYADYMTEEEIEILESMDAKSLVHELALTRIMLRRLAGYLDDEDLSMEDVLTVVPLIFTGVRTVVYLLHYMADEDFDWDEVLDDIKDDWDINI